MATKNSQFNGIGQPIKSLIRIYLPTAKGRLTARMTITLVHTDRIYVERLFKILTDVDIQTACDL